MNEEPVMVGRVLRASTTSFAIGCQQQISAQSQTIPPFGALLKAPYPDKSVAYGLVYNIVIEDDLFVRQLVGGGVENEEYIADQRQRRQVPVVVDVLVAGYGLGLEIHHRLPPHPPTTLDRVYECNPAELVRFTLRHDWLRTALAAPEIPADQLLAATLRGAAQARPPDQREDYLVEAGRELARLLALDLTRLEGILRQLR